MDGSQPSAGGPAPSAPTSRTFLQALLSQPLPASSSSDLSRPGSHKGEAAVYFEPSSLVQLTHPFRWPVIGKFSQGWPKMDVISKFLEAQDFKAPFKVGLMDPRHVIITFSNESMIIIGFILESLCSLLISPCGCSNGLLIFILIVKPPLFQSGSNCHAFLFIFFRKDALFSIASLVGHPLRCDAATARLTRPSVARVQLEIDLQRPFPSRVWIGTGDQKGFWQRIEPDEELQKYCSHCYHVGHDEIGCRIKHPELRGPRKSSQAEGASKLVYRPKLQQDTPQDDKVPQHPPVCVDQCFSVADDVVPDPNPADAQSVDAVSSPLPEVVPLPVVGGTTQQPPAALHDSVVAILPPVSIPSPVIDPMLDETSMPVSLFSTVPLVQVNRLFPTVRDDQATILMRKQPTQPLQPNPPDKPPF